jgi:hypothetical protein
MTRNISLNVDDCPIEMDYFVQGFVDHTVYGMISSLGETGEINLIEIILDGDSIVISVNSYLLPLNDFAASIITSTLRGIVSALKGVESMKKIHVVVRR